VFASPSAALDILVTDPAHQRRGAGKMLVEHGTRIADELGVRAVVEASTYGRHLYELCGFRMEKFIVLQDVPERYSSRPRQEFFWMVRPSRAERDLHGAAEQRTEEKVTRTEKVGGVKVEEVREVPV
jgi:N-acetylglutamate synthase-like GNAT family acetyltransferase